MTDVSIRTLLLEYVDSNGASHIREMLMVCLGRCYHALEVGGRLAVLIGDVRRSGKYTPIVKDVLNFPYGEIRSIIIKVQHNCTSDRKRYGKMEDVPSFLPDIDQNEGRFQGESGECCSFSPPAVLPEDA